MRLSKDLLAFGIALALILIVILGFIGKSVFFRTEPADTSNQSSNEKVASEKYPALPAEALRLKISKNETVEIIDIRPQVFYEEEHIPFSKHRSVSDLSIYTPENENAEIIIIALADDSVSMEQTDRILKNKPFAYAFLEGGIASWKAINGNIISAGDPNSVIDRSKVSFKTAEDIKKILDGSDRNLYAIIDTRKATSYQNGHIPTALNIPIDELERRRDDIPSGRQIIAYGVNDLESFRSAVRLYDLNTFSPTAIENGFASWMEKKYDVEK